jgi:hypothetical protein
MECGEAISLFEAYARATDEYVQAAVTLSNLVGSHEKFAVARQHAEETYAKCQAA